MKFTKTLFCLVFALTLSFVLNTQSHGFFEKISLATLGKASLFSMSLQDSKFANAEANSETSVTLSPTLIPMDSDLQFGSKSEWARFNFQSSDAITLRYFPLHVSYQGLDNSKLAEPSNFKIYPLKGGEIDFRKAYGEGEAVNGDFLRIRMKEGLIFPGKGQFALTAPVFRDKASSEKAQTEVYIPNSKDVPALFDWAFMRGSYEGHWLDVQAMNGAFVDASESLIQMREEASY